MKIHPVGA